MRTKKLRGRQLIIVKCRECGATMAAVDEPQRNKAGYRAAMQGLAPNVVIKAPSSCPGCGGGKAYAGETIGTGTSATPMPKAPRKTDALAEKQIAERKAAKPGKAGPKAAKARKKATAASAPKKAPAKKKKRKKGRK